MAANGRHLEFSIFEILLNTKRFCWKWLKNIILCAKLRNKFKNMNNYQFLIIFIPKIESLTANSNSLNEYDDVINVDVT